MGDKMKSSLPEKKLILDNGIYSAEAVKLAAYVFSGRVDVKVRYGKSASEVMLSQDIPEAAAGEFMNEVLNQQCRIDLAKKNSRIAGIIVTKALLQPPEKNAENPADRLFVNSRKEAQSHAGSIT